MGAVDRRVKCVVSQVPLVSGHDNARRLIRADYLAGVQSCLSRIGAAVMGPIRSTPWGAGGGGRPAWRPSRPHPAPNPPGPYHAPRCPSSAGQPSLDQVGPGGPAIVRHVASAAPPPAVMQEHHRESVAHRRLSILCDALRPSHAHARRGFRRELESAAPPRHTTPHSRAVARMPWPALSASRAALSRSRCRCGVAGRCACPRCGRGGEPARMASYRSHDTTGRTQTLADLGISKDSRWRPPPYEPHR